MRTHSNTYSAKVGGESQFRTDRPRQERQGWITWGKNRLWPALRESVTQWNEDDCSLWANSIAYYGAFSLFPLLLVLISGFGFVLRFSPGAQDAQAQILEMVARNTSASLADQLQQMLKGVQDNAGVGGPVGLGMLIVGALGAFTQLDRALERIWKMPASDKTGIVAAVRGLIYGRLKAFLVLLGIGAVVIVGFLAGIVMSVTRNVVGDLPMNKIFWEVLQMLLTLSINSAAFALLYRYIPKAHVNWSSAFGGAILAAVTWEIGRQILSAFIVGDKYGAYGIVGAFIGMMVWLYYAASVLLLGAELAHALDRDQPSDDVAEA